ncbi:MAG TPA: 50S ribosomal protein L17 [bacterium]|nr:50S ribosomal protein L17 [bacterium]
MRHKKTNKKLGREKGPRKSLYRATATNLLNYESINTTLAKAKATRSYVEKIITKAKHGTLSDRRSVSEEIHDKDVVQKLFTDIAKRYETRNGGYTRIIKTGPRLNDGAEMAIFELVDKKERISPKEKKGKNKKNVKKSEKKEEKKYNTTKQEFTEDKKINKNKVGQNTNKQKETVRKVIA